MRTPLLVRPGKLAARRKRKNIKAKNIKAINAFEINDALCAFRGPEEEGKSLAKILETLYPGNQFLLTQAKESFPEGRLIDPQGGVLSPSWKAWVINEFMRVGGTKAFYEAYREKGLLITYLHARSYTLTVPYGSGPTEVFQLEIKASSEFPGRILFGNTSCPIPASLDSLLKGWHSTPVDLEQSLTAVSPTQYKLDRLIDMDSPMHNMDQSLS